MGVSLCVKMKFFLFLSSLLGCSALCTGYVRPTDPVADSFSGVYRSLPAPVPDSFGLDTREPVLVRLSEDFTVTGGLGLDAATGHFKMCSTVCEQEEQSETCNETCDTSSVVGFPSVAYVENKYLVSVTCEKPIGLLAQLTSTLSSFL